MSLSSTTNKVIHDGNGATTEWPFSFPVLETDHLAVIFTDASGAETTLSPTLYGAAGIGSPSGGSVTYPLSGTPIASNTKLTIVRTVPYTQTTVLSNQGGYYPEVVERRFDQIYMALQQLEERVSRFTLSSISDPTTEQSNYSLIQQLQPINILTSRGDLLTRDGSAYKRLARGTAGQFLGVDGADLAWAIPSQPVAPQGRLTLVSGEPVMTGNQTGQASMFYTPYVGSNVPIRDGSAFVPTPFTERSNDLTQSSTGKAGPAAAGPYQVIDAFVWNDGGTVRLTRGPKWRKAGTFTITVAAPAVVTWVGHGLHDGATWTPESTTGNLPTGAEVVLGTTYFVTKVDADTFKLSTTLANLVAGMFINTSGTQSGVHTGANYTAERGTGAGTSELERVDGIWVNKHDIVNGPAAHRGTFVGTCLTDASSQVNWHRGGAAVGGTPAQLCLWNTYNRVEVKGYILDTTVSYTYNSSQVRPARGQPTMRVNHVHGLAEDFFDAKYTSSWQSDLGVHGCIGIGINSITTMSGMPGRQVAMNTAVVAQHSGEAASQPIGGGYAAALEVGNVTFTMTFYNAPSGSNGPGQVGLSYTGRF
ncbi:MAG: hypothetical protein A3D94_00665 [Alphaproteobacteria bacterium RIFCSPHIGHO2_12_FULL_66_14]|nr:MAG: hypothetical protein A3D94_00665 [Alphaproteobacteria bacterium RIFCSPHIGHO2_12_FULL_66_14]